MKDTLRIVNIEAVALYIQTKARAKCNVPLELIAVKEKRDNMKKVSLLDKRNPANGYTQKFKKVHGEPTHTKKD